MNRIFFVICIFIFIRPELTYGATLIVKDLPSEIAVEASASYVLGDNDTRIDARNIALNEAKRSASEMLGTHVSSELVIENDQILKDKITIVAAAFLKVKILKEEMIVSKDQRSMLTLKIRAQLDKSSILSKITAYRSDAKQQEKLVLMQNENIRLQKELDGLNVELSKANKNIDMGEMFQKPRGDLMSRRSTVITLLDENLGQTRKVFEKGGLLELAKSDGDEYKYAVDVIDQQVGEYIKNNTKITMSDPKFVENVDGTYDVHIGISWSANSEIPITILSKYFELSSYSSAHTILVNAPTESYLRKNSIPYISKLFDHLVSKKAVIRVEIGNKSTDMNISVYKRRYRDNQYVWVSGSRPPSDGEFLETLKNPVVIKSVSKLLLKNQTAITAQVLLVDEVKRNK